MTALAIGRDYPDPFAEEDASRTFENEVTVELQRLQVRDEARRRHLAQRGHDQQPPAPLLLTDFLAQPEREQQWRIDGLLPAGARVLLAAAFKAGKSTLVGNIVRCLVDGDRFLDRYTVTPTEKRVVILDDELDHDALRRWLREQGITGTDRVAVVPLRGKVSTFDLLDPDTRAQWADTLAALDPSVIVLDCLRPVLDALGLDEKTEAGRFLVAFDELIDRAGADEAVVVHHMGHSGERSRGDSRLRDWPDVEWRIVRQDPEDPASPRYFTAFGRDVDQPEQQLSFDPDTRHLSISGGNRQEAAGAAVVPALLDLLAEEPGLTGRQIEERLREAGEAQKAIRSATKAAIASGQVHTVKGARGARCHHLSDLSASVRPTASPVRRRGQSECVSASKEDALTRSDEDTSSASGDALLCDRCGVETDRPADDTGRVLCRRHAYPLDDESDDE